ncbi:hypothetical protein PINS_up011270 [Pythium insidiosum]|nr:hypothetical protein PINS_up011270 [Pythium insidiosum]
MLPSASTIAFALFSFVFSPVCVAQTAAPALREVPLHIGAGCEFSNYSRLKTASSGDGSAAVSYRFLFDGGLGRGLYVLQFKRFSIPRDDVVTLRPTDADRASPRVQTLFGRNTTGAFFSQPIDGDGFIVELTKSASDASDNATSTECHGFEIDGLRFTPRTTEDTHENNKETGKRESEPTSKSFSKREGIGGGTHRNATEVGGDESVCGTDESQEAVCLSGAMYTTSQSVARLTIRKDSGFNVAFCTGFLLGCEGHLLTNQHCIRNWMDALNTMVEFLAEAQQCGAQSCAERGACPGSLRVRSTALVAVSSDLDYALVKLTPDDGTAVSTLLAQVGYLQLRADGPRLDEEIYIPQHPLGWGKRIATTASGKPGRIESMSVDTCGGRDAGYYVDTQEGSSGSPVLATSDNKVVALHHCGGCPNGAIPSPRLIEDLQLKGVLPRCAVG